MKAKLFFSLALVAFLFNTGQAQDQLVQETIQGTLAYNQGQVIALAEAFPEDLYDWRPAEGISSVREALLHVAAASYFLTSKLGFPPPEEVDMMGITKITGKDNVIAALKKANAFALEKITLVESGDFSKEVDFGFAKMNTLSSLLTIMEHNGEHKGQLIAYARSNGVVPPWSK